MTDTERSDKALAPVTYLFGARPEAEAAHLEAEGTPSEAAHPEVTPSEAEPRERSVSSSVRGSAESSASWAVPGVDPAEPAASFAEPTEEDAPDTTRAHNVGLHALTKRGQSVAEMTKLLENRELEPDVVAAEIKRLKSVGLLDDFALAETLVRTLSERKKLGKSSIASQLRQRKINPVAIDAALEELDGDDELSRATEVAIKRAGQLRSYDETTAKRRLTAYLQRRGYSGSVLSGAMSAAFHPAGGGSRSGGPRFE